VYLMQGGLKFYLMQGRPYRKEGWRVNSCEVGFGAFAGVYIIL